MTRADPVITMTPIGDSPVMTGPTPENSLAISQTYGDVAQAERDAWEAIIDQKLIEWARHPERLEEVDLIPPTQDAIRSACALASDMRDQGWPPPQRAVPDGDGGIVLERWDALESLAYEVAHDGGIEFVHSHEHQVIDRQKIL